MKTRVQKTKELADIKTALKTASITIFTSFARAGEKGLRVADMRELKKALYGLGAQYSVQKKTLLDKALKDLDKKDINIFEYLGSLGVVIGQGNESSIAKYVYNFRKKFSSFKYFSALLGDQLLDESQFITFARLPSREVLLSRLLAMLQYPIRSFAVVINQIAQKT